MNIVIAGAGKVGFNLAKTLYIGHNVTIIDKNAEALRRIQESLDILTIKGDVENARVYDNLIDKELDLFIAVTNIDNVNLISTFIAQNILNIKRKIIRLQNDFFANSIVKEKFGIDMIIFPTNLTSRNIASLLDYPKANNVKFFKYTDYKLISIRALNTMDISNINSNKLHIVGVERDKKLIIPFDESTIQINDLVYFFGTEENIRSICSKLEQTTKINIKKCVVFGGGKLAISISKALLKCNTEVKLLEKDLELCEFANDELKGKASVINLKYETANLFEDEGLENADIFIAATDNDEYNIIKSLEAKNRGINKVVSINNEMEYYNLMHSLGIIVARGPKISAYNTIMEHISSSSVVIQKSFCGGKAVVFMRKIFTSSYLIGRKLKPLKTKHSVIFYIRGEKLFDFNKNNMFEENDIIVAFSNTKESEKVRQWIYEL